MSSLINLWIPNLSAHENYLVSLTSEQMKLLISTRVIRDHHICGTEQLYPLCLNLSCSTGLVAKEVPLNSIQPQTSDHELDNEERGGGNSAV